MTTQRVVVSYDQVKVGTYSMQELSTSKRIICEPMVIIANPGDGYAYEGKLTKTKILSNPEGVNESSAGGLGEMSASAEMYTSTFTKNDVTLPTTGTHAGKLRIEAYVMLLAGTDTGLSGQTQNANDGTFSGTLASKLTTLAYLVGNKMRDHTATRPRQDYYGFERKSLANGSTITEPSDNFKKVLRAYHLFDGSKGGDLVLGAWRLEYDASVSGATLTALTDIDGSATITLSQEKVCVKDSNGPETINDVRYTCTYS